MNKYSKRTLCFSLTVGIFLSVLLWAAPGVKAADPTNNTIGTATEITAGTYVGLGLSDSDDVDFYNISLAEGDNISVEIYNMAPMLGLWLWDTESECKNASYWGTASEKVWWLNITDAGNYTIEVDGVGSEYGSYDMRIETPVVDDIYEDNDGFDMTVLPETSTTANLQLYDVDCYRVDTLDAFEFLNVTIQRSSSFTGSSQVTLEVNAGTPQSVLVDPGASATLLIQQGISMFTPIYVVVSPVDIGAWGNYTLILQQPPNDDAYEPNDDNTQAKPINLDDPATILALRDDGATLMDNDYYQVQLKAGDTLWAKASLSPSAHVSMQIRTTTDVLLADTCFWPSGTDEFVNYTTTTTGAVNFRVTSADEPHLVRYYPTIGRLNVTHPIDISYAVGTSGSTISWTVDDSYDGNPAFSTPIPASLSAKIYKNGVALAGTYTWSRTKPVAVDVAGLAEGTYTFKIVAQNSQGVTVEDTVIVTVTAAPGGVPGYPVVGLAGFALVAIITLVFRKKRVFSQN